MQRIITDILVQDPLPSNAHPSYDVTFKDTINRFVVLKSDGSLSLEESKDGRLTLSLLPLDREWKAPYRDEPDNLKEVVTNLLLKASELSNFEIELHPPVNPMLAEGFFAQKFGVENWTYTHVFVASKTFFDKNIKALYDAGVEELFITLDNFPVNKIIALPSPEYVGVISLDKNNNFGAFIVVDSVLNIKIV